MIGDERVPFLAGLVVGSVLFLLGAATGYFVGRGRRTDPESDRVDRRRMLRLLRELGAWTREYRGDVAQYQDRLDEISTAARGDDGELVTAGVMPLVERLMHNNHLLQSRLDAAEKQLQQQTEQIENVLSEARTDGLTGLANRRAFDHKLNELFAAFERGGPSFVLALVDIDHFKRINDTYGHPAGDAVLRQMASRMDRAIQDCFLLARFGGEEFAVLLPSPLSAAAAQLDMFRKSCAAKPLVCDGAEVEVTVSIGLGESSENVGLPRLLRRADEALYAAKGIGRNRTYFHDGDAPILVGAPEVAGRP